MLSRRVFDILTSAMTLLIGLACIGCSTYLNLRPDLQTTDRLSRLEKQVGIYYSSEFQNYQYVADPYGNMHSVYFPIGSASMVLLDKVFAEVIQHRVPIDHLDFPIERFQHLNAIIVPAIEEFSYYSRSAGTWHYWARIRYSFSIFSTSGERITRWEVTGTGTSAYEGVFNEKGAWAKAAETAMQDAAVQFRAGFEVIPEAVRWSRGLDTDASRFDIEVRGDRLTIDVQEQMQHCSLDDIVSIRILRRSGLESQAAELHQQMNAAGLLILSIQIQNLSSDEMRLFTSDIRLQTDRGAAVGPIPKEFFTAVATAYHGRLPVVSTGTQLGAVTNLLFALANASALVSEEAEKAGLEKNLSGELRNVTLGKSESVSGLLFFSVEPAALHAGMELVVPVALPGRAVRYRFWLPVLADAGE